MSFHGLLITSRMDSVDSHDQLTVEKPNKTTLKSNANCRTTLGSLLLEVPLTTGVPIRRKDTKV